MIQLSQIEIDKINDFCQLIKKWNGLDLVGKNTISNIWHYHINEAISIYHLLKNEKLPIIDFGAGSGIIAFTLNVLKIPVTCVERNESKQMFIQQIAQLPCTTTILNTNFVCIARGITTILKLLELLKFNLTKLIIFKSENYFQEITEAKKFYKFIYKTHKRSMPGIILEITNISKLTK